MFTVEIVQLAPEEGGGYAWSIFLNLEDEKRVLASSPRGGTVLRSAREARENAATTLADLLSNALAAGQGTVVPARIGG